MSENKLVKQSFLDIAWKRRFEEIKKIIYHPLFWLGLVSKVFASIWIEAEQIENLFLPFILYAADNSWNEAYDLFGLKGGLEAFPYPLVMYWTIMIPIKLIIILGLESGEWVSSVLRFTLIIFDFIILIIIASWLKRHTVKAVILLYWLSPLLFYINYIHGQLDVIPISFLIVSLYYLFRDRLVLSAIFLAIAISSKTHTIVAVPLFILFLYKNRVKLTKKILFILNLVLILGVLLFYGSHSKGFVQMVFNNSTQKQIFLPGINYTETVSLLFLPAMYIITLALTLRFVHLNRDLLITIIAFVFAMITVFLEPLPGWYYWFMPFMIFFILKISNWKTSPELIVLFFIQIFALIYWKFEILQTFIFTKIFFEGFSYTHDLIFTVLQTSVLIQIFMLFRIGFINKSSNTTPYIITISGDSGVGKTTLSNGLLSIFGEKKLLILCGDGMHKWERGDKNWKSHTHLNPKANELHNDYFNFRTLKLGKSIYRREYDHNTGRFTNPKKISPKPIIISEGLHSSYLESMRSIADLKIFLRPNEELAMNWKIARDSEKRGYSQEKILNQIKFRLGDKEKFIAVQEKHADIIFEIIPRKKNNDEPELGLKIKCVNTIYAEYLSEFWKNTLNLEVEHSYLDDQFQELRIFGSVTSDAIREKSNILFPQLVDIIYPHQELWPDEIGGLMCHFVIFSILFENTSKTSL